MGYMRDHAIVVSSWDADLLNAAHAEAQRVFGRYEDWGRRFDRLVSPIVSGMVNGHGSFFVGPDGSKEGWTTSDAGDAARDEFTTWLDAQRYVDGSTSLRWVEVFFADDDRAAGIVAHDGLGVGHPQTPGTQP